MAEFTVKFSSVGGTFSVQMRDNTNEFNVVFDSIQTVTTRPDVEYYDGAYEVTPQISEQTLPTAQKNMMENMVVRGIPYAEVSNNSGGMTVTIGG